MSAPRLVALSIDDFGLIRRARVDFSEGLSVFSGETGSGKTMLLGALGFALGERAGGDVVRAGASRATVAVELDLEGPARENLIGAGYDIEPGEFVVIAREMNAHGKSSARINGRPASASAVREIAARVADFIGQHEQQRLLSGPYQGDLLDRFAGDDVCALRDTLALTHTRLAWAQEQFAASTGSEQRIAAEIEDARFALREIDDVRPVPGEDDRLRERREYLAGAERIAEALALARRALVERDGSGAERVGEAVAALTRVSRFATQLEAIREGLVAVESALSDVSGEIARAIEATDSDAGELEVTAERLDRIERLKRRHGGSIASVLEQRAAFAGRIDDFEARDLRALELRKEVEEARADLERNAAALSRRRTAAAAAFEERVSAELRALSMPAARFEVSLPPLADISARGGERVEFLLAPNAGEPARALAKAASGGELSRVLLALVVALADRREPTALVFDEIDSGIGGATASAVGERLGDLSRTTQVVCVTHLAQIASWSDLHYTLKKTERPGETAIEVIRLDKQADVESEIARMLSGSGAKVALEHAGTLLRDARKRKGRLRISA